MKYLYVWLLGPALAWAQPNPNKIIVTDLTRIRQVGNITLSPDGRQAAYTLTTIEADPEKPLEYDYRTHIYLTNLQPGDARALTFGAESARQPTWSPDGKQLAFVRNVKGKSQLFVMPLSGGEARQLTNGKYGVSNPKWSPDGTRIAFSVSVPMADMLTDSLLNPLRKGPVWSLEKPGFATNDFIVSDKKITPNPNGSLAEIRAYLAKDVADKKANVINRLNFLGEANPESDPTFTHLYVTEIRPDAKPQPLTRGYTSVQAHEWLPDGSGLLAVADRDSLQHPDRALDNAIVWVSADGSGLRQTVLAEAGQNYFAPQPSPDGRQLAFLVSPSSGVNIPQIGLATLSGRIASSPQRITFDRSAGHLTWAAQPASAARRGKSSPGTYSLYFSAPSNGGTPLYRLDLATKQVSQLTDFESGVTDFDVMGNTLAFAKTEVANPSELYRANALAQQTQKLTTHNDWVATKKLSFPEKRTYTNSLGQTVDFWIMKPTAFQAGRTYPLLLNMHGGPTAMWGPGEASMWHEFQYMCAQGYGLVYANPRGSGGYGLNFQRANINDWGRGPAEDVLAAATAAARESWADTSRQVITGGSYAGYLTAWIVGHDHRFKAAFAQRGVYDLTTFMGEANAWRLVPNYFVYPWAAGAEVLDANSPYTFVQNIRTPLLIKHGENDLRTGVSQSEMLYKSLKILNRPVEYVRMPGATHELSRTGNVRQRIDRLLRIYEFFERYVGEGIPQK